MDIKERIITEGISQFMQYGARSVTMNDISTALGMSKKTVYQFFQDKEELVWECIECSTTNHSCQFHEIKEESADPIDHMFKANQYFNSTLASLNPLLFSDLKKYYPKAWKHFKEFRDAHMHDDIKANLEGGVKLGLYRADLNIDLTVRFYSGLVDMVFDPEAFPIQEFTRLEVRRETITIYLNGIATDKGRALIDQYTALENQ